MKRGFRFLQFFATAINLCLLATGASGAVLKSVQSNITTMGGVVVGDKIVNVLLTAVVPSNTFVVCQSDTGGITSIPNARATCELTSPTQLTITTSAYDPTALPNTLTVRWYVAEFLSGVFVQRGLATLPAVDPPALPPNEDLTIGVPVAAVNLASSFVLITERMTEPASQTMDERWTVRAQLTTSTNLKLTRNVSGTLVKVAWQVIQIDSAAVQSGTTSIPFALTSVTVALNPLVDINHTFLVFSRSAGLATGGDERLYQIIGQITAPNITFTRALGGAAGDQVDIVWHAVRMTDGTTVQSKVCGPSGKPGIKQMPAVPLGCLTIPNPIATNRSIALLSTLGEAASATGVGDLDDTSWRSDLAILPGFITLYRSGGASLTTNATVAWQVVQFNNTTNTIDRVEVVP